MLKHSSDCVLNLQALKDISLKRHASRDNLTVDLSKKQRVDMVMGNLGAKRTRDDSLTTSEDQSSLDAVKKPKTDTAWVDELGNLEEFTQKRTRNDTSRSDDDSMSERSYRQTKRSKVLPGPNIESSCSSTINSNFDDNRKSGMLLSIVLFYCLNNIKMQYIYSQWNFSCRSRSSGR